MVAQALAALARDYGDVDKTAERLIDDEFMVPAATLYEWKTEVHAEQYSRIAQGLGSELERDAIQQLQQTLVRSNELRLEMLERVGGITRPELVSQALRAISDAGAKASTELMQITGRPVNGAAGDGSVDAMLRLLGSMQSMGLVSVAPSVQGSIDGTAEDMSDRGAA